MPNTERATLYRPSAMVRALHRGEQGTALASALFLGLVMVLISAVMMVKGFGQEDIEAADHRWEQSLQVAEGGVNLANAELTVDPTFNTGETAASLATKQDVIAAADARAATDLIPTPEGEIILVKPVDDDVVYAVGYVPSRDAANRQVRVVRATIDIPSANFTLGNGALISEGDIEFKGNGGAKTTPADQHVAHIKTNGKFKSGSKNPVDGDVDAVETVTGGDVYGTATEGAEPYLFPTQEEIDAWQAELKAEAMTGPTYPGIKKTTNIVAPAYIDGDIKLSGGVLNIYGPGVVYVTGDVELTSSSEINNGAVLAIEGTLRMGGQAVYGIIGDPADSALVSFAEDPDALTLAGQGLITSMGIMWAANGGVVITGDAAVQGAVIAGGDDPNGGITFTGNGGVAYPPGLGPNWTKGPKVAADPYVERVDEM